MGSKLGQSVSAAPQAKRRRHETQLASPCRDARPINTPVLIHDLDKSRIGIFRCSKNSGKLIAKGGALRASFYRPTGVLMAAITDWIDDNWKQIECTTYSSLGFAAYGAAWASAFTPAAIKALGWVAIGGAFELAYNLAGCNNGPLPPPPQGGDCQEVDTYGRLELYTTGTGGWIDGSVPFVKKIVEVQPAVPLGDQWRVVYVVNTKDNPDGQTRDFIFPTEEEARSLQLRINPDEGGTCTDDTPPHPPGEPIGEPTTHTEGECEWTITPIDSYVDQSGVAHVYYRVEANDPACGGPYEFWSSNKGPEFVQPNPDNPEPTPPPDAVTCPDPCKDYDSDFAAIQAKLDEIKACACDDQPPTFDGEFRTISFRSDETSPYGKSRLRKRFRYRSVSGNDLGTIVDHWKDFSFEGGPYRVRWISSTWRSPEIWAASEAEGKRVIQHAATEAGFSPLETGRWSTRLSGSGRQGVPGTMRIDTTKGFYWITARDGSDTRPIVACVRLE